MLIYVVQIRDAKTPLAALHAKSEDRTSAFCFWVKSKLL